MVIVYGTQRHGSNRRQTSLSCSCHQGLVFSKDGNRTEYIAYLSQPHKFTYNLCPPPKNTPKCKYKSNPITESNCGSKQMCLYAIYTIENPYPKSSFWIKNSLSGRSNIGWSERKTEREERNTSKGYLSNGFKERCIERGRREDNLRKAGGSRDDTVEMCPWTHIRNSM